MRRPRRFGWVVAALSLFAAAAWLMTRREAPAASEDPPPRVDFPRQLRDAEVERMLSRRTLPPVPAAPAADGGGQPPPEVRQERRDPFLAALPAAGVNRTTVVVEANAVTNSPIGQLLLDCLRNQSGQQDFLEVMRQKANIDLTQNLDRIAMTEKMLLVSGHFQDARWDELMRGVQGRAYGDRATIYLPGSKQGVDEETAIAVWGGEIFMFGENAAELEAAIDRLEGRSGPIEPAIPESATYGEIYGVLAVEELADLLPEEDEALIERLQEAATGVELHVDTRGDVAINAEVWGEQAEAVDELARSMGAALSLARLKAKAEGEDDLVELLDLARVSPNGDTFGVEVALPMALLEKRLASCRQPRETKPAPDPIPEPAAGAAPELSGEDAEQ